MDKVEGQINPFWRFSSNVFLQGPKLPFRQLERDDKPLTLFGWVQYQCPYITRWLVAHIILLCNVLDSMMTGTWHQNSSQSVGCGPEYSRLLPALTYSLSPDSASACCSHLNFSLLLTFLVTWLSCCLCQICLPVTDPPRVILHPAIPPCYTSFSPTHHLQQPLVLFFLNQ